MGKKDKAEGRKKKDAEADGNVSASLAQAARAARSALSRHLSEAGLYAGQDTVIAALAAEDGQSLGAIADRLGVRAPTITKTINRLMVQGFVEKRGSEDDGRRAHVFLTETGRQSVEAIERAVRRTEKTMLGGLSGKEAKLLGKLLRRLDQNFTAAPDEA